MPKPGGLCKRLFRAIEALLARGCTVHYAAVRRFPIEHPNCHWHRFWWPEGLPARGPLFWAWLHLAMPFQLLYLAFRHRVTHVFAFSINYGAMTLPIRLLRRIPYALFLRADTRRNNQINKVPGFVLGLEACLESAALWRARVVAVSRTLVDEILARHRCVRPTIATVLCNEPPRGIVAGPPYAGGTLRLAVVGVLERRKRADIAIKAMRLLKDSDILLTLFGSGPDEEALRCEAADLVKAGRVDFAGWCATESIWKRVHLLLHCSDHEGQSNAVLEALSAGRAVLASDIPEHREWLPEVFLVSADDVAAWAHAIAHLAECDDRIRELGEEASALARRLDFDWEARACAEILSDRTLFTQEAASG